MDDAGEKIGGVGQDVAVLLDAGDRAFLFHLAQEFLQTRAVVGLEAEFLGEFDLVEGLVFGLGEQAQNFRAQVTSGIGGWLHRVASQTKN